MARQLKPKPEYSANYIDEAKDIWCVTKYTPNQLGDMEEESVYRVDAKHAHCECVAGLMGKFCRHLQVIDIFKANPEKIGSIHYYNFDRKHWT